MHQYEAETYYDANGRIVFTPSKGLPRVGLKRTKTKNGREREDSRPAWEDVRHERNQGTVASQIFDDTDHHVINREIIYRGPFSRCRRRWSTNLLGG